MTVSGDSQKNIYCDSECGSLVRPGDVIFPNGAAAEAAGYRSCLTCRPRLCGGIPPVKDAPPVVETALLLIKEGFLNDQSETALAARLRCSHHYLRRTMIRHLGASPTQISRYRQTQFARQLATETTLDAPTIARAVGLTGQQQLENLTTKAWGYSIASLRRRPGSHTPANRSSPVELLVRYTRPYSFQQLLDHLKPRATPGVEEVTDSSYRRITHHNGNPRVLQVEDAQDGQHLRVQVHGENYINLIDDMERLRTLFAIDESPGPAVEHLSHDGLVGELVTQQPWVRVPRCWDRFEGSVRIIIGQQISVTAATTIAGRIAHKLGRQIADDSALSRCFPSAADLADADLSGLGFTNQRKATLQHFAEAVADGSLDLTMSGTIEEISLRWCALPGIGPWTAQVAAMRILQHDDAMPSSDLGIRRNASALFGIQITARELDDRSAPWRPFRSWVSQHLWNASHKVGTT